MAAVTFPQISHSYELDCYVARLLGEAGIPAFIWGPIALNAYFQTDDSPIFDGWVVPDSLIDKAVDVLDEAKFPPCKDGDRCTVYLEGLDSPYPGVPHPDHHYHIDHIYSTQKERARNTRAVFLYRQSRLFMGFPEPPVGCPPSDDPYYTWFTSHNKIKIQNASEEPRTDPPENRYPVKIPLPARYLEAMFLLAIRDIQWYWTSFYWCNSFCEFIDFMELQEEGSLDQMLEEFRGLLRQHEKWFDEKVLRGEKLPQRPTCVASREIAYVKWSLLAARKASKSGPAVQSLDDVPKYITRILPTPEEDDAPQRPDYEVIRAVWEDGLRWRHAWKLSITAVPRLKLDDIQEPWRELIRRHYDRVFCPSLDEIDPMSRYMYEIYLDMREKGTLPTPDPKKGRVQNAKPFEERLQRAGLPIPDDLL